MAPLRIWPSTLDRGSLQRGQRHGETGGDVEDPQCGVRRQRVERQSDGDHQQRGLAAEGEHAPVEPLRRAARRSGLRNSAEPRSGRTSIRIRASQPMPATDFLPGQGQFGEDRLVVGVGHVEDPVVEDRGAPVGQHVVDGDRRPPPAGWPGVPESRSARGRGVAVAGAQQPADGAVVEGAVEVAGEYPDRTVRLARWAGRASPLSRSAATLVGGIGCTATTSASAVPRSIRAAGCRSRAGPARSSPTSGYREATPEPRPASTGWNSRCGNSSNRPARSSSSAISGVSSTTFSTSTSSSRTSSTMVFTSPLPR